MISFVLLQKILIFDGNVDGMFDGISPVVSLFLRQNYLYLYQ